MQENFENLSGDDIDDSTRFITDRKFELIDNLHAWADTIANDIDFHFICASYK